MKSKFSRMNLFQSIAFVFLLLVGVQNFFAQDEKAIELGTFENQRHNRSITISRAGYYRLSNSFSVRSGDAITITASNVTLDLGGNTVSAATAGNGRGIFINGASGVEIRNGKIGGFNTNVAVANGINVRIRNLQIVGQGLAPNNGPSEVGVLLFQTRGAYVENNTISSVNLGIFVRGGNSTGNRIFENVIVGGATPANNLLGICYNPATEGTEGPRGDNIYNNHITRFGYAFAISPGSVFNVFNENIAASFSGSFREPEALTTNGGTNVSDDNIAVTIPATVLP